MKLSASERKFLRAVEAMDSELFTYARIRELSGLDDDDLVGIQTGLERRGLLQPQPVLTNAGRAAIGAA